MEKRNRTNHRLTTEDVARICDAPAFVDHYRAALLRMGLWASEEILVQQFFRPNQRILDLGCGAGRVSFGLWDRGFRNLEGVDVSSGMVATALAHAEATGRQIPFHVGDATRLSYGEATFDGVIFGFGGLMQIPGRERRQLALLEVHRILRPGGTFIFTTHDRDMEEYRSFWKKELRQPLGEGLEFGDIHEEGPHGLVFVHVPDRREVEADLREAGWVNVQTRLRSEIAVEDAVVEELTDPCRFWVVKKAM